MTISWHKQLIYQAKDIKKINPIPDLAQEIISMLPPNIVTGEIITILSEIYNNAVDHGLLNLTSELKQEEDGLVKYYNLRQERLRSFNEGFVKIDINFIAMQQVLKIKISDSGKGFDCEKYINQPLMLFNRAGRGLYIINKITPNLEYNPKENLLSLEYKIKSNEQHLLTNQEYRSSNFNSSAFD